MTFVRQFYDGLTVEDLQSSDKMVNIENYKHKRRGLGELSPVFVN
jgi:hypothetical protein